MPESKKRKKAVYTPPVAPGSVRKKKKPSPIWLAPLMLAMFGVGVLWLVVFYISQGEMGGLPYVETLNNWNLVVGFGFIVLGFVLSTQWR